MRHRRTRGRAAVAALGVLLATATAALAAGGTFVEPDVEVLHTFERQSRARSFGWAVSTIAEPGFSFPLLQRQNALIGEPFNGPNFDRAPHTCTRPAPARSCTGSTAGRGLVRLLGRRCRRRRRRPGERHPRRSPGGQHARPGLRRPLLGSHGRAAASLPRRAGRRQLRLVGLERGRRQRRPAAGRTGRRPRVQRPRQRRPRLRLLRTHLRADPHADRGRAGRRVRLRRGLDADVDRDGVPDQIVGAREARAPTGVPAARCTCTPARPARGSSRSARSR